MEDKKYAEIKVTYEDGSKKVIDRGMVFSVREEEDRVFVSCEAFPETQEDFVAVLAIVSRIAREAGIDEERMSKAEKMRMLNRCKHFRSGLAGYFCRCARDGSLRGWSGCFHCPHFEPRLLRKILNKLFGRW